MKGGGVTLSITLPPAGDKPSEFRRAFIQAVRDAATQAAIEGRIDFAIAEEVVRALPVEELRQ